MTESEKFLDKILTYVDDIDKHWFMCHKADIKAYAKIYHKEQLNLCGVNTIIGLINEMELDGETVQDILEQTGMDEQMYKQLSVKFKKK